ncbi:twin-arginine translocation signal domain-containing protein [Desulfobacterium sp. N47]|uniref:Tat pathway signal sequence domain protein n=1 Tax=uncultured Desulfobacterium sp. TaxID=201089 RepID=E1Y8K0_9BACT|nr:hypothetical protein N47_A09230 [uncultured Desulfobacterium sp.]
MATKEKKDNKETSRRKFLKNAGLLAGGIAGSMGMVNLAGAASGSKDTKTEIPVQGKTVAVPEPVYEVYDTDILILGGGFAAVSAAMEAFGQGVNLLMVDKGPFGFSGADDVDYTYICDKNGDFWMKNIPREEMNRGLFSREVARKILEGKGGPHGGV